MNIFNSQICALHNLWPHIHIIMNCGSNIQLKLYQAIYVPPRQNYIQMIEQILTYILVSNINENFEQNHH